MTKEFLKTLYADSWLAECVDHLADEFFNPDKEIKFLGESGYGFIGREECPSGAYQASAPIASKLPTLVERIMSERAYRQKRMLLIPSNENEKIYYEETLKISREIEDKLIRKMTARNSSIGDIDKAKAYPIDELLEFRGGFAKCIFHNDLQPSMRYYEESNRVHCFSCGKSWDSIDVYQKLNNCSFKESVNKLNERN